MLMRNGNWWTPKGTAGKSGDQIREENFSCIEPIKKAVAYCTKHENAIDVGTWIGDSTVLMAGLFTNVIGFEPHPIVHVCCEKNLQERGIDNVAVYNIALSNENKLIDLHTGKSTFMGWVSDKDEKPKDVAVHNTQKVQSLYLDSYDFEDIDFIKIDVDSHEGYLLQGAQNFFETNSPVVLIEYKQRIILDRQPEDTPDAFELLNSYGYSLKEKVEKADWVFTRDK